MDIDIRLASRLQYELHESLNINLPYKLDLLFEKIRESYTNPNENIRFAEIQQRETKNNIDYFINLLMNGVKNSVSATYYNLCTFKNISSYIRNKAEEILEGYKPQQTQMLGFSAQKLIIEYEHFTLHSRIFLDRLNWFLNYYFKTDTGNIYKLYKFISSKPYKSELEERIICVIDTYRPFLDTLISSDKSEHRTERDHLAHRDEIQFVFPNYHITPDGKVNVYLFSEGRQFDEEADSIMIERFNSLSEFCVEILNCFFEI